MKRRNFASLLIFAGAVTIDGLLLNYFSKEFWLSLWPFPLIFLLVGVFVVVFCLRRSVWGFRFVGGVMILAGQYYFLLSLDAARTLSTAAILHLIVFCGIDIAICC